MSPPAEGEKPGNWPSLLEGLLFADTIDLLQELIKLFRHSSPDERRLACWAMGTSISVPILSTRGVATEVGTLLADTHAQVRAAACHTLLEIGDYSVPVLPQLLERLKDPVKSVRCDAVKTVAVVAKNAMDEEVSAALAALLRPEERPTTALAVEALGELQAVSAVPQLEELLEQARLPEVRRAATVALARLKGEPQRFAELLAGGQLEDRRAGLKGLLALGEKAEDFAPQVAQRLREPLLRSEALEVLRGLGAAGVPCAEATRLASYLSSPDMELRYAAVQAIGELREALGPEVVKEAAELLHHEDPRVRAAGISALGALGEERAGAHAQSISKCLADDSEMGLPERKNSKVPLWMAQADHAAAHALSRLGAAGRGYAALVAAQCSSAEIGSSEGRILAMKCLAEMGEAATGHLVAIADCLDDPLPAVAIAALAQLAKLFGHGIGDELAQAMVNTVRNMEVSLQPEAIVALGVKGAPQPLLLAFAEWLKEAPQPGDDDQESRFKVVTAALEALGAMGEAANMHSDAVVALLSSQDEMVRKRALEALGKMRAVSAADSVAEKLQDVYLVRSAAAWALGQMAEGGLEHQDKLAGLLGSPMGILRQEACEALGTLASGGQALSPAVLDALKEAARDAIPCVRSAAGKTLACAVGAE